LPQPISQLVKQHIMGIALSQSNRLRNRGNSRDSAEYNVGTKNPRITPPKDDRGRVDLLRLISHTDPGILVSGCRARSSVVQETFADKLLENRMHPAEDAPTNSDSNGSHDQNQLQQRVSLACKKGMKAAMPNQDSFLILRVGSIGCYGVFDGHGENGHAVSGFIAPCVVQHFACDPQFKDDPCNALRDAFFLAQKDLIERARGRKSMDCTLSGTTATLMIDLWRRPISAPEKQRGRRRPEGEQLSKVGERQLCIAHCGDSRAVLGYMDKDELMAMDLTNDHKPSLEAEHERIVNAGGAVRKNNGDPHERVFVKNMMHPGLAMSRSLSDTVAQTVGVTCEPDVRAWTVEDNWHFVLLCSDGVWEFISSKEAVDFVGQYASNNREAAANALAEEAKTRWEQEEVNSVDDITVMCIWFACDTKQSES